MIIDNQKKKVNADEIYAFIKANGPTLAMKVASEFKIDSSFAGAFLSDLTQSGKLLISNITVGRNKLYYTPESFAKLDAYTKYLNEKDKRAADRLKEKKILFDNIETPLIRVCLRNIPDYSKAFEVFVDGEKYIFWRWFTTTPEDAKAIAISILEENNIIQKPKREPIKETIVEQKKETIVSDNKNISIKSKNIQEAKINSDDDVEDAIEDNKNEAIIKNQKKSNDTVKEEKDNKKDIQKTLDNPKSKAQKETISEAEKITERSNITKTTDNPLISTLKNNSDFFKTVGEYFEKNNIIVKDLKEVKKGKDAELKVEVPTPFGNIPFFVKLRDKKTFNHGDISEAIIRADSEKLPLIIIISGTIMKKAMELYSLEEEISKLYKSKAHNFTIILK